MRYVDTNKLKTDEENVWNHQYLSRALTYFTHICYVGAILVMKAEDIL